jgi:hypothetical protein
MLDGLPSMCPAREQASGPLDDGSGVPKHPGMDGYNAASECTDNMCEEGMHIGGFYQPGGRGYTGQFFHGVIDEVRVWQKPRTQEELKMFKDIPLRPKDHMSHAGLLFYFPFDEQGMDSGQEMIVVESRAYPWFGQLGNSSGKGRPLWVESGAPLRCMVDSLARPCVEAGVGNLREVYAAGTGGGRGGAPAGSATGTGLKRRYSRGAMASAVLLSMLLSAAISVALTRAVVVDGLELSCTADALPAAGRAIARAVRGLVSPEPGSGAPSTSGTSGLAPAVVPSPLAGGSGYQTVE